MEISAELQERISSAKAIAEEIKKKNEPESNQENDLQEVNLTQVKIVDLDIPFGSLGKRRFIPKSCERYSNAKVK